MSFPCDLPQIAEYITSPIKEAAFGKIRHLNLTRMVLGLVLAEKGPQYLPGYWLANDRLHGEPVPCNSRCLCLCTMRIRNRDDFVRASAR